MTNEVATATTSESAPKKSSNDEGRYARVCCITKPWMAVLVLCMATFFQGFIVNGLVNVTVSPLQSRFQLDSAQFGFVAAAYDITGTPTVLLITLMCSRLNKSLVIGLSFLFIGLGSIIYSLPHFISESYTDLIDDIRGAADSTDVTDVCPIDRDCNSTEIKSDSNFYYGFFVAGQCLNGIGGQAIWTLGAVYIDENLSQKAAPFSLGLLEGSGVFGPAVGFLLAGALLNLWVDGTAPVDMTPSDKLWIGNWWVGFVIAGVCSLIVGVLICLLPNKLASAEKAQKTRRQEFQSGQIAKTSDQTGKVTDIHKSIFILIRNVPFMAVILAGAVEMGLVSILSTYGTKYAEEMYDLSTSTAAIGTGAIVVLSGVLGQIVGGLWISRTNPTVRKQLIFGVICLAISWLFALHPLYKCEETTFIGSNLSFDNLRSNSTELDIESFNRDNFVDSCSTETASCDACSLEEFDPICIDGKYTFFTPCHAGCDSRNVSAISTCSCIPSDSNDVNVADQNLTVTAGTLKTIVKSETCSFGVYAPFLYFTMFFTFVNGIPATNSILRVVPPELRSQAMGINIAVMRLLGTIPGPIIGGKLIDATCIAWQYNCGERGSCRLYDRDFLSKSILGVYLVYKTLGLLCWVVAIVSYKPDMDYGATNAVEPEAAEAGAKNQEVQGESNETTQ